ncbi:MAG: hypothetical protein KAQ98_10565 [Bacteriovoracaceae bacterium]|nr:hypothetical protein [Bacteriovoracaceae bacterium]
MTDKRETFKSSFTTYEIVPTKDGHPTVWSEHFKELAHSTEGSYDETVHNYVNSCNISDLIKKYHKPVIFEVGLGVGIGLLATLEEICKQNEVQAMQYISVEIDEELVYWALKNVFSKTRHNWLDGLKKKKKEDIEYFHLIHQKIEITIILGDARKTLAKSFELGLIPKVHAIYQDPFSPSKNPSLWTVEWFSLLKKLSHTEVILSTYSSATGIRCSLFEAGWCVEHCQGYKKKRSMTKARLHGKTEDKLLQKIKNSTSTTLWDKDLCTNNV